MKEFMLGAMYWLNPNHGRAEIEEDMRRIRDNNFNIIRSFIWWEKVQPKPGAWEFGKQDLLYEAADKYGLRIMETFGLYLPLHLQKELLAKGIDDRNKRYPCFDRPEVAGPMEEFIRRVVARYKDAPALEIWNLWNEPTKEPCRCPSTLIKFAAWLKAKYPAAEALKRAWLGECQVFSTACPDSLEELTPEWLADAFEFGSRGRITPMEYDWHEFACDNTDENCRHLRDIVRSLDPAHETHVNPASPISNGIWNGINEWKLGRTVDSLSVSVHPSHHFFDFESPEHFPQMYLYCIDEVRSWAQGRDAWVGELQAGTTFFHPNCYTPTVREISHTLYHSLGRGLRGVLFWEWQAWRSSMKEVAEFSLRRAQDGAPTERSEAAKAFGADVAANSAVLAQAVRPAADTAIFASMETRNFKLLQQRATPYIGYLAHENNSAAYGCYKALNRANLAVDFVTELEILEDVLDRYRVLYLPLVEIVSAPVAAKLRAFVERGGALWADGRCGFLDEHVFLRDTIPGHGLDEVFGCEEADFIGVPEKELRIGEMRGFRHIQYLEPTTGEAVASANGRATAVRNRFGKGETLLAGSLVTLGIQKLGEDEATMAAIAGFALEHGAKPMLDLAPAGAVECSVLRGPEADVFILGNRQKEAISAEVRFEEEYCSFTLKNETLPGGKKLTLALAAGETQMAIGIKKPNH